MQPRILSDHQCVAQLFDAKVPAGFPSPAADHAQKPIDLNQHLFINPTASYLFRVSGTSMNGIGIYDGDTIIVDRSIEAKHNHIVLAVVDNTFTVKRLYKRANEVKLIAENDGFKEITFSEFQELTIWGVVTFNLHRLLNV